MRNQRAFLLAVLLFCAGLNGTAHGQDDQADSLSYNRKHFRRVNMAFGGLYLASMAGLYQLWYANSAMGGFRFFNDNANWKQVDKVGHHYSAYHLARNSSLIYREIGLPDKKAAWMGGLLGFVFMTPIEVLDGFSQTYGASWGDLLTNTTGCLAYPLQLQAWGEERFTFAMSFSPSPYAGQNPDLLGRGLHEQLLKDYNGQTYWLSLWGGRFPWLRENMHWPKLLGLSLGYGAQEMRNADDASNLKNGLRPTRQWYLAPDLCFSAIPTKRKGVKFALYLLDAVKLPAPTLEYRAQPNTWRWHWLFF